MGQHSRFYARYRTYSIHAETQMYPSNSSQSPVWGNRTLPSLFIASNLLQVRRLDGDATPTDTLSITRAIKAEAMERRKEPGFRKVHEIGRFYEFGLVAFMAQYIKFTTQLLSCFFQPRALISVYLAPCLIRVHRRCLT